METRHRMLGGIAAIGVALAFVVSAAAQQAGAPGPTKKDPLRFTAFAVSLPSGINGMVDIEIERWTTDAERKALLTTFSTEGQDKLLKALQDIKVRCGFLKLPNTLGWDIKYAKEFTLQDGTRQIVIVTDKPVSFLAAATDSRAMDYPFTMLELRFDKGKTKGEGRLLAAAGLEVKNGRLELENYGQEPVRLTEIDQKVPKK